MSLEYAVMGIAVMAVATYATRAISLVLFRGKITNAVLYSFLTYVPYGVLAALIFPGVFHSTACLASALAGLAVALVLSFFRRGLMTVAISATLVVFVTERIIETFFA